MQACHRCLRTDSEWDDNFILNAGTPVPASLRLCGEAAGGQILISQRVYAAVEALAVADQVGELLLKGFVKPVPAYNVWALKD